MAPTSKDASRSLPGLCPKEGTLRQARTRRRGHQRSGGTLGRRGTRAGTPTAGRWRQGPLRTAGRRGLSSSSGDGPPCRRTRKSGFESGWRGEAYWPTYGYVSGACSVNNGGGGIGAARRREKTSFILGSTVQLKAFEPAHTRGEQAELDPPWGKGVSQLGLQVGTPGGKVCVCLVAGRNLSMVWIVCNACM